MKDYEVFIGPFSAHAYSGYEAFKLVTVARTLNLLDNEEAEEAVMLAADVVTGGSVMRAITKFAICDRARKGTNKDTQKEV